MSRVLEELSKLPMAKLTIAELNRRNWFSKNLLMRSAPSVYSGTLFAGCAKFGLKCTIENKIMEVVKNG